jgi:hypothetical protein
MASSLKAPDQSGGRPPLARTLSSDTLGRGPIGHLEPLHGEQVGSGRSPAAEPAIDQRRAPSSGRSRHLAAVARSFGWADESAARGDYANALGWLDVIAAIGDPIPQEYQIKRRAWLRAAQQHA